MCSPSLKSQMQQVSSIIVCCIGGVTKWSSRMMSDFSSPTAMSPCDTSRRWTTFVSERCGCIAGALSASAALTSRIGARFSYSTFTASAAARAASSVSAATTATRSPMVSGSVVSTFSSAIRSGEGGLPEQLK